MVLFMVLGAQNINGVYGFSTLPPLNVFPLTKPPQNHKQRLWKTTNAPLSERGVYGFGVCVYGFLGVIVLVYLREVGFALSLSLSRCVVVVGVWVG